LAPAAWRPAGTTADSTRPSPGQSGLPIAELSPSPTARWVDAARPFVPARSVGHFAAQSDCPASDSHESALRTHLSRLPVRARRAVALAQAVYAPSSATPAAPAARHQESGASVAG